MNRELRRLQAKQAKWKPNRSREQNHNVITLMGDCFDLPDKLMRWLRLGELYYNPTEGWLLPKESNEMLCIDVDFRLWIKQWERIVIRAKVSGYDDKPLHVILNSLKYHKPITESEIKAAESVLDMQRAMYRSVSHDILRDVIAEVDAERKTLIALKNEIEHELSQ